jgi:hypothetical protein
MHFFLIIEGRVMCDFGDEAYTIEVVHNVAFMDSHILRDSEAVWLCGCVIEETVWEWTGGERGMLCCAAVDTRRVRGSA